MVYEKRGSDMRPSAILVDEIMATTGEVGCGGERGGAKVGCRPITGAGLALRELRSTGHSGLVACFQRVCWGRPSITPAFRARA